MSELFTREEYYRIQKERKEERYKRRHTKREVKKLCSCGRVSSRTLYPCTCFHQLSLCNCCTSCREDD